jgi:hypothetical protein
VQRQFTGGATYRIIPNMDWLTPRRSRHRREKYQSVTSAATDLIQ